MKPTALEIALARIKELEEDNCRLRRNQMVHIESTTRMGFSMFALADTREEFVFIDDEKVYSNQYCGFAKAFYLGAKHVFEMWESSESEEVAS